MQVWELMKELAKYPAGHEIAVSDAPDGWLNSVCSVEEESDMVFIRGDGIATRENEEE